MMLIYAEAMNCPQKGIEVIGAKLDTFEALTPNSCAKFCHGQAGCTTWTYFKNDPNDSCHTFLSYAGFKENTNACSGEWDCTDSSINSECA